MLGSEDGICKLFLHSSTFDIHQVVDRTETESAYVVGISPGHLGSDHGQQVF